MDHEIELVLGALPPAQVPDRMPPTYLEELKRLLKQLVDGALIRPSEAPYGAPVLFQKKKDGNMCMCMDYHVHVPILLFLKQDGWEHVHVYGLPCT